MMDTEPLFFWLPAVLVDMHVHGRDMLQSYKTTVYQTLLVAINWLGEFTFAFMPNTDPAIKNTVSRKKYKQIIRRDTKELGVKHQQYIWFKVTDSNLPECARALLDKEVIGLKIYGPEIKNFETLLWAITLCWKARKVLAVHCDDPLIIEEEGYSKRAEIEYVRTIISLAERFPGVKVLICHVSCRESAELILATQKNGMLVALEICPQYLWFDSSGTHWNPALDPNFYLCLNRLRGPEDREYLISLLNSDNDLIIISSDHAPHTEAEKLNGVSGFPSLIERVAVIITLAIERGIFQERVAKLLTFNAIDFFGLDVPKTLKRCRIKKQKAEIVYGPEVTSPWGDDLYYPVVRIG